MNCHIILPFATIAPAHLGAYLIGHGWRRTARCLSPDAHWYYKGHGWDALQVLVPLHTDWADYPDRIRDAIETIAADEQGCCREVFARVAAEQEVER